MSSRRKSQVDGPHTRYVHVGPTRVRVRMIGRGKPLLLLMGIGGNLDMWEPLAARLPHRRLVMFDFPGTGGSSLPWFPPTMAHNALFVRLLMRKLGLGRVDVLGYSWGGLLAQQLAAQHPRSVDRLVLACTGMGVLGVPCDRKVASRLLTPKRYYSPEYLTQIAPGTYGGRFRLDALLVAAEVARRMEHPPSWTGYAFQMLSAGTFATVLLAPLIRAQTLILAGGDDPIVRTQNQHGLHRLLANSQLRIIADAGHLLLLDSPGLTAPIIEAFLDAGDTTHAEPLPAVNAERP